MRTMILGMVALRLLRWGVFVSVLLALALVLWCVLVVVGLNRANTRIVGRFFPRF